MIRALFIIAFLALPLFGQAAPSYITLQPLSDQLNTRVQDVKKNANILPLITWGGDIATVYANGGEESTVAGSIFAQNALNYRLIREDVFANQVNNYLSGDTPYLRGTLGMINAAADVLNKDPRTKPVVFYQMTWSTGGDALVVKNNIRTAKDLRGKTIAVQAYGPHVDYLLRVLQDSGLNFSDVNIKWLPDLTGTDDSPMAAFYESDIDAAFVIIPDALALTSNGGVGNGLEGSVKDAKILMSTKTASRVIADVYAVRNDYYSANKDEVERLAKSLMLAAEKLETLVSNKSSQSIVYTKAMSSAAALLLDDKDAIADTEGLYADCEFVHFNGNVKFFDDNVYPRNFEKVSSEILSSLSELGLLVGANYAGKVTFDYSKMESGLANISQDKTPRFRQSEVAALISRKQQQGSLDESELFSFEVYFSPNQNVFTQELYKEEFKRVVELASTYGGAIVTVEGHSDPMGYLKAKKNNETPASLGRIKQSAKNLSVSRALAVRDAITNYTELGNVPIDASQFEAIGHGISQPSTGVCGDDPCAPKNEVEWRSNMRVVFRLIQVESESNVFTPL